MPLPPLKVDAGSSLADGLYQSLFDAIQKGELKAGERLTEVALAEHVKISRTPVREALRRLQSEGLIEPSGRSLIVSGVNVESVVELCAVREVLEGLAARLAATRSSDTDLLVLREVVQSMADAVRNQDFDTLIRTNHAFHTIVWQAAHNRYLTQRLDELRKTIERLQASTLRSPERQAEALAEHQQMLVALEQRNADELERMTREHFRKAEAIRLSRLRLITLTHT